MYLWAVKVCFDVTLITCLTLRTKRALKHRCLVFTPAHLFILNLHPSFQVSPHIELATNEIKGVEKYEQHHIANTPWQYQNFAFSFASSSLNQIK